MDWQDWIVFILYLYGVAVAVMVATLEEKK